MSSSATAMILAILCWEEGLQFWQIWGFQNLRNGKAHFRTITHCLGWLASQEQKHTVPGNHAAPSIPQESTARGGQQEGLQPDRWSDGGGAL